MGVGFLPLLSLVMKVDKLRCMMIEYFLLINVMTCMIYYRMMVGRITWSLLLTHGVMYPRDSAICCMDYERS